MNKRLVRIYGRAHLHFITFSCYRRLPFLRTPRARNLFVQILGEVRELYKFSLVGYVVMPEHVHLLIGEPATGTPLPSSRSSNSESRAASAVDARPVPTNSH
jgi:putative transposase